MAGGDVELPRELAKMIEEDTEEEEERASVLGQLASPVMLPHEVCGERDF